MVDQALAIGIYLLPMLLIWSGLALRRSRQSRKNRRLLDAAISSDLHVPSSLHPAINPNCCLGCGTCIPACPEKNVLGLIDGKARLIEAANCVGHGACADACPTDAITLVLGTEERGVEVPKLDPRFETSVPGIFVAGELGGMGLIRNAVEQGRQVIESVRALRDQHTCDLDVVIVGAGPAGLAASLAAHEHGLRAMTLDQDTLGGAVAHYPRRKLVLTSPVELPSVGRLDLRETSKEALLEIWNEVAERIDFPSSYSARVERIERQGQGFVVATDSDTYLTRSVVLAIGRRGTPRKLGVPGEALPKVVYRLTDPEHYAGANVLVVGGGDSALEAAATLGDLGTATVTLSYRGDGFSRAKPANRERIAASLESGAVAVWLGSHVRRVEADLVEIETEGGDTKELRNDAVIVCAGGVLPTKFLQSVGIETDTLHGRPLW